MRAAPRFSRLRNLRTAERARAHWSGGSSGQLGKGELWRQRLAARLCGVSVRLLQVSRFDAVHSFAPHPSLASGAAAVPDCADASCMRTRLPTRAPTPKQDAAHCYAQCRPGPGGSMEGWAEEENAGSTTNARGEDAPPHLIWRLERKPQKFLLLPQRCALPTLFLRQTKLVPVRVVCGQKLRKAGRVAGGG